MNIVFAIQNLNLLTFHYDGFSRTVEPHTYGIGGKGHHAVRGYQVAGGSQSGEFVGWKLFHVNAMQDLSVLPGRFTSSRQGYKRDDKAFQTILAQL